jgi:hypothetical protein
MTMIYRAAWAVPTDPATSRNSQDFERHDAGSEKEAKRLVETSPPGEGFVEVVEMPGGDIVRKLYKDAGEDWRVEHPADNQSHMKIDIGEYE